MSKEKNLNEGLSSKEGGEEVEEGKGVNFILGLLVGALVGASIAILLAPQSGVQTREQIKERADEFKKKAEKYGHDLREDAEDWIEKGQHVLDEKVKCIKGAISKIRKDDKEEQQEEQQEEQEETAVKE